MTVMESCGGMLECWGAAHTKAALAVGGGEVSEKPDIMSGFATASPCLKLLNVGGGGVKGIFRQKPPFFSK